MKKQSASKNFAILGAASILVKVLAIVYLPFQTKILGDYGNGIVAKGYNIFTFLFSLSNAGLPNAISKLVAEQTAHKNFKAAQKILKCAYLVLLVLGIIVAVFMAIGAKAIANWMDQPHAYLMLLFLSPTLIFTSVSCALRGYLQGRQNMVPVAISNVLEQILNSVFTVVFAFLLIKYGGDFGAAGTTVGTIIGAFGAAAFLCYVYFSVMGQQRHREIKNTDPKLQVPESRDIYKEIARYSFPAILNTIATSAASLIDTFIGTQRLEAIGYTEKAAGKLFGVYSYQYNRIFTLAIAFTTALVTTMIPAISEALALKNQKLVRHRIGESYKSIYLITIPSIFGISFLAQPLITLVFASHNAGADLVVFGTWTAIFMTIQYVQSGMLIAAGKPMTPSLNLIIGMAVKIAFNYFMISIPALNIKGAIIGTAVGWIIAIVLNQVTIKHRFKFKIYFIRMMIKPAFASLIMGLFCFLFYNTLNALLSLMSINKIVRNDVCVLMAIGIGAFIYFAVMVLIKGVKKTDITRLPFGGKIYRMVAKVGVLRKKLEEM